MADDGDGQQYGSQRIDDSEQLQPLPPAQPAQVDFSGTWSMDLQASDSLDDLLQQFGVAWPLRKLLDNLPVQQEVTQNEHSLNIAVNEKPPLHRHRPFTHPFVVVEK